jgi:hypothetical protein
MTDLSSQLILSRQEKAAACDQAERLSQRSYQLELEKKSLEQTMKRLKTETERLQAQVEEEKSKQRLLMDYPMGRSTPGVHPERQIAANNMRILLLEEFNNDLRAKTAPQVLNGICEVSLIIFQNKCIVCLSFPLIHSSKGLGFVHGKSVHISFALPVKLSCVFYTGHIHTCARHNMDDI